MKTTDFNRSTTSAQLKENLEKKFGTTVDLAKYDREQLEDIRNKFRTKIFQQEGRAGINDLLANETYQRDKAMLELLNTRIKEMLGENLKQLRNKMDELNEAKKGVKSPKYTKKASGTVSSKDYDGDGKKESPKAEVIGSRKKAAAKKGTPFEESAKPDFLDVDQDGDKKEPMKKAVRNKKDKASVPTVTDAKKAKKAVKESAFKHNVKFVNESIEFLLREDEEGKAKAITAAGDMVNDFTSWMQRVGQYQTKTMIELADSIKADFGAAESETFKSVVAPALAATLETLTQQREIVSNAVAVLAGEAVPEEPMGDEPTMAANLPADADMDMDVSSPDIMNPSRNEFGASDAAAGAPESSGREMRESKEAIRTRKLIEAHSIMSKLAK
jgi:hypothetical protein